MKEYSGSQEATDLKLAVVVSRFNSMVTDKLLQGAVDAFREAGGDEANLVVVRVPGSYELPQAARRVVEECACDAVVCLGCLIRGETDHYHYLASYVSEAIGHLGVYSGIPVTFGVLTVNKTDQALDRAGRKYGNKGAEAARAAIEMANLSRTLRAY